MWYTLIYLCLLCISRAKILFMRSKFSFLSVGIWFNVTKCKFALENFKMLAVFSLIFAADTKIIFRLSCVAFLSKNFVNCYSTK